MKYALMVYADAAAWSSLTPEEASKARAESMPRWLALFEEMAKADPGVTGFELDSAKDAKVVRVRDGSASSRTVPLQRRRS